MICTLSSMATKKTTKKQQQEIQRRDLMAERRLKEWIRPPRTDHYLEGALPESATLEQREKAMKNPLVLAASQAFSGTISYIKEYEE